MKKTLLLALVTLVAGAAQAADVGVSIAVSQPGLYGRIDVGRFPLPVVISPQPMIVHAPPVVVARPDPVYLWVPPEHRRHWHRHCGAYGACAQPVLFVQDGWYRRQAAPVQYVEYRGGRHRGHGRGHRHDD